jgi:hypothetical protein
MKFIIFIAFFVEVILGAALSNNRALVNNPDELFQSAWEYQDKFIKLQDDINTQMYIVKTAIPNILRLSTNTTLGQVNCNANEIFGLDRLVRTKIMSKNPTPCLTELLEGLDAVTNLLGFSSSNKLKDYDRAVNEIVTRAYKELQNCQASFSEVQQVVVRSFIGANVFTMQSLIQNKFKSTYEKRQQEWDIVRPNISGLIIGLSNSINLVNVEFDRQLSQLRTSGNDSYNKVQEAISVCEDFDESRVNLATNQRYFRIEDFLPKIE